MSRTDDGRAQPDSGVATVWTVGAIAVVFVFVAVGVWLAAATVARHRVAGAADLAALAAAAHAGEGQRAACARARWVNEGMDTRLRRCRVVGLDAYVELTARPPGPLGALGVAAARARAGPVLP